MLNILFIGCVQFSKVVLQHLLSKASHYRIVGVVTKKASRMNADFQDLSPLARENGIPWIYADQLESASLREWVKDQSPDVIYCFGWSHLIKQDLLSVPPLGVIGYHPAELPQNRGRHPIIWALVIGLTQTASTFFIMDEGADSGDIISQEVIPIAYDDDAGALYHKLLVMALNQVDLITHGFVNNQIISIPQEHDKANYWRKRNKNDGCIDWRMSSNTIYNLVRALSKPYPGAHCEYLGQDVHIWKAKDLGVLKEYQHWEPGKVIASNHESVVVKCGQGVISLLDHEFPNLPEEASYL